MHEESSSVFIFEFTLHWILPPLGRQDDAFYKPLTNGY